ncbi:putative YapH protein [Flavobacterium phage vB_FspP_elemoC_3-9B]|nr:putative YapH protein [Flavobacterium phage vB_FspP_elemoC_3-9B]
MFISIANAIGVNRASGVKYDSDYQAVLNYATTQGYTLPSASQQIIQNQLVIDLKAGGIWNKLDVLYIFANDGGGDFGTLNWKSPLANQATLINTPTFTTNEGFIGNGTSSYIDTNFTPSTDGVNYQLDNASRYFYGFDALNGARFEGNLDGINNMRYATFAPGFSNLKINSGANNIMSSAFQYNLTSEMKSIHRTSDTDIMLYNAEVGDSRTLTSVDLPTSNQTLFRVGTNYVSVGSKMYAMGSSLVTENTDFVTAFDTYLNSL